MLGRCAGKSVYDGGWSCEMVTYTRAFPVLGYVEATLGGMELVPGFRNGIWIAFNWALLLGLRRSERGMVLERKKFAPNCKLSLCRSPIFLPLPISILFRQYAHQPTSQAHTLHRFSTSLLNILIQRCCTEHASKDRSMLDGGQGQGPEYHANLEVCHSKVRK